MSDSSSGFTKRLFYFGAAVIFATIAINYAVAVLTSLWLPLLIIGMVIFAVVVILTIWKRWR